jgi:hypothetical protein
MLYKGILQHIGVLFMLCCRFNIDTFTIYCFVEDCTPFVSVMSGRAPAFSKKNCICYASFDNFSLPNGTNANRGLTFICH